MGFIDLGEVEIPEIIEHLESYGYSVIEKGKLSNAISDIPSYELRDLLCDIVGVNHHTPKEEILKLLGDKFI